MGDPTSYPNTYIDPVDQCHLSRGRTCGLKHLVAYLVKTSDTGKRVSLVSSSKSNILQPIKKLESNVQQRGEHSTLTLKKC